MEESKTKNSISISKLTKFKLINIGLFLITLLLSIAGIIISQNLSKNIQTEKQQILNQQETSQSSQDQQAFFESNPEIINTLSQVLPNQDTIIKVVEDIENLQKQLGISTAFEFSSIVPTNTATNSYVSFIIKTNTTTLKTISFLRSFEKLPYLTQITSIDLKTPQGIGGPVELAISGRIYVQNPF